MTLLIVSPNRPDLNRWQQALQAIAPDLEMAIWPQVPTPEDVTFALAWQQPAGIWPQLPNLRCVSSFGAGVDHLLQDPDLPIALPIVRLVDPLLAQSMFEYIAAGVMGVLRDFDVYEAQQVAGIWQPHALTLSQHCTIGIMGLGQLGTYTAQKLVDLGFNVVGWARSPKQIAGVTAYVGDAQLPEFLQQTQILVCLLPLTPQTRDILNLHLFAQLPRAAYLINVARGAHLVEADLVEAIHAGYLRGACLDVFRQEPLPPSHPFWAHPQIRVTPHCSSITNPESVAPQIVENYRRSQAGEPLLNQVSRSRGY
ncbi:2-hydroxyacid dehydrogenase [Leptolyngbya iicbica]|uniref:Glyoxylate/hydroxypyruvate reductase A n=2 Tax=Cyanophyceae TaxID=3028117 RepID=A0A4Q7EEN3_9CYAN|nr:glyoxylate/hydroxypyruvate reductase A [Leptolyngbya sp. LK]RZM81981.1 glyoxylate/hydroxypyruvate reductase A [Leptolyngbya sp. LK]